MRPLLIALTVPIISLCATFILLYAIKPHAPSKVVPSTHTAQIVHAATPTVVFSAPIQLRIDRISVAASVQPVGLTPDGNMDIDENPEQVAWYKLGPKPGEEGSAVIAGHYGWKNSVPSVFNDLHTLVKGDKITTVGDDGRTVNFIVNRSEVYAPTQDATSVFKSDDGKAHLNLITCQGEWNGKLSSYTERLVVFADAVKQ